MSSRGDLIGQGPSSGLYSPGPVPPKSEDLPTYVNDELLIVGGIVNGILEGGAFPPQAKLPKRWREGSMVYFIQALDDEYVGGDLNGQKIITSAGVWLYRKGRWWKIIDDPSEIVGSITIYKLTADGNVPDTPATGPDLPPSGWSELPPTKPDKGYYIWASVLVQKQEDESYVWSTPTIWSAGVEDGGQGQPGAPGVDGRLFDTWFLESASQPLPPSNTFPPTGGWVSTTPTNPTQPVWSSFLLVGEDGSNPDYPWSYPIKVSGTDGADGGPGPKGDTGDDGRRGTLNVNATTSGTSWNNQTAYNAIANDPNGDGVVYPWDTVTMINTSQEYSEMRYYTGGGNPGNWQPLAMFVDGDIIVTGTVAADKLVANSITAAQIAAGTITGDEINAGTQIRIGGSNGTQEAVILDATNAQSRIWVGNLSDPTGAKFRVEPNGTMHCEDAVVRGDLYAGDINGAVGVIDAFKTTTHIPWVISSGSTGPATTTLFTITIEKADFDRRITAECWMREVSWSEGANNAERHFMGGANGTTLPAATAYIAGISDYNDTSNYTTLGRSLNRRTTGSGAHFAASSNFTEERLQWQVEVPAQSGTGTISIPLKGQLRLGMSANAEVRVRGVTYYCVATVMKLGDNLSMSSNLPG